MILSLKHIFERHIKKSFLFLIWIRHYHITSQNFSLLRVYSLHISLSSHFTLFTFHSLLNNNIKRFICFSPIFFWRKKNESHDVLCFSQTNCVTKIAQHCWYFTIQISDTFSCCSLQITSEKKCFNLFDDFCTNTGNLTRKTSAIILQKSDYNTQLIGNTVCIFMIFFVGK